jgi:hypothetical protein
MRSSDIIANLKVTIPIIKFHVNIRSVESGRGITKSGVNAIYPIAAADIFVQKLENILRNVGDNE